MDLPQPAKLGSIGAMLLSLWWRYLPAALACQISMSAPSIGLENWSEILPKTIILCPMGEYYSLRNLMLNHYLAYL